jgi:hypothetical protein
MLISYKNALLYMIEEPYAWNNDTAHTDAMGFAGMIAR